MRAGVEQTKEFLQHILPSQGKYILVAIERGENPYIRQYVYEDLTSMAEAALKFSSRGFDVYHACASFKERREKGTRKQDNVYAIKSVWADLDCGEGKPYASAKEAAADVLRGCKELGIPRPTIVVSGRGLHTYWVFDKPVVGADEAKRVSGTMKAALQSVGVKIDPSRTGDTASVLRPVGTLWFKEEPPREVRLHYKAEPVNLEEFLSKIEKYDTVSVTKPPRTPQATADEFSIPKDYPPANAKRMIKECAALRHVLAKRGNVEEPLWYAAIGTVSYAKNGFKAGHLLSDGYPGYTFEETQARMERWQETCTGPATCEKFKSIVPNICAGCPYAGSIKSPIQLGYEAEKVEEQTHETKSERVDARVIQIELDEQLRHKLPDELPFWESLKTRYRVVGNEIHGLVKRVDESGQEVVSWLPLTSIWFYPFRIRKNSDGDRTIDFYMRRIRTNIDGSKRAKWEVFNIPGSALAEQNTLLKALGNFGIYEMDATNNKTRSQLRRYIIDAVRAMEEYRGDMEEYDRMGWLPNEEEFVIGESIISDGVEHPTLIADNTMPENVLQGLIPKGDASRWIEVVNKVYNREGAEPYQFAICAAFAAPLIRIAGIPDFHGIPIAFTGVGANGKTTVAQVACSIYGNPLSFYSGGGDAQTTTNAMLAMVGKMRNLPYLFDEITGRKGEDLQTILYAISNGRPKLRLQKDGQFQQNSRVSWDTIVYLTSNDKIIETLARQGDHRVVDATQVRVFEVHMAEHVAPNLFADVNPHELQDVLANHYGHIGREYLKWLTKNMPTVRRTIANVRSKLLPRGMTSDDMKERFYRELVALTVAGATFAKQLGFIKFNVKAIAKWAINHIKALRADRSATELTPKDVVANFLAEHIGRVVHTEKWSSRRTTIEDIVRVSDRVSRPIARIANKPAKVFILKDALDKYLTNEGISHTWFFDTAVRNGFLIPVSNGSNAKERLYKRIKVFKGTDLSISDTQFMAYEFDPREIISSSSFIKVYCEDEEHDGVEETGS